MKYRLFILFLLAFAFQPFGGYAQQKPGNACYISNGRIYFQIDKRWTTKETKEYSALFSLDSSLIEQALLGNKTIVSDSVTWQANSLDANIIELSKQLTDKRSSYNPKDVFLVDDKVFWHPVITPPQFEPPKRYGINKFVKDPNIQYSNDTASFFLPGFTDAEQVYLSGTFNNWSTMQHPMLKTDAGWMIRLKLEPRSYLYKFIVDGRWIHDANNRQKEKDGNGGYNSIVFLYNHVFTLKGHQEARKVFVSGSFNNWRERDLQMQRVNGGWNLPLYIQKGTHAYKYIVDGEWITDPDNNTTHSDAFGNINSFFGIGDTLVFKLNGYDSAKSVLLSGSFNAWSTSELLMQKTKHGWEMPYVLGPGNYEYKFIVDGKWMADPANPLTSGTGDFKNSYVSFEPNHTFVLSNFPDAKRVIVTGSFNGWNKDGYVMTLKEGKWVLPVFLKPGKYSYKFLVDGKWMIDPANDLWEGNQYDTGNSVLWIE